MISQKIKDKELLDLKKIVLSNTLLLLIDTPSSLKGVGCALGGGRKGGGGYCTVSMHLDTNWNSIGEVVRSPDIFHLLSYILL